MSNVRITWTDPTVRDDGTPLAVAELDRVDVGMRVGGATLFTLVDSIPPGVQEFIQTDLPPGTYEFSLVAVDKQSPPKSSTVVVVPVSVAQVLAAPGPVTGASATVT